MNIKAAKEKQKKITQLMYKKIEKLQNRIMKIKKVAAYSMRKENYFWAGLNKDLKNIYSEIKQTWVIYSGTIIPLVYKTQIYKEVERIKRIKTLFGKRKIKIQATEKDININLNSNYHKNTINVLLNDISIVMFTSLDNGYKYLSGLLLRTQQQILREEKINQLVAEGLAEKGTVYQVRKKLLESLIEELGKDSMIQAGSKKYSLKTYSELLARTKIREAQSYATLNVAMDSGSDLVQVSSHNTRCPICIEYEGKVYSISGKDKDFPALLEQPPYHPNCLHSLTTIFKEIMNIRGKTQDYIDFSNGKTEIHPTRKSHIPAGKRKTA